jgi:hypothetical protein
MISWVRSLDVRHLITTYVPFSIYAVLLFNKAPTPCTRTPEASWRRGFHTIIPEPKRWAFESQETPTRQRGIQQNCNGECDVGWDVGLPNVARTLGA